MPVVKFPTGVSKAARERHERREAARKGWTRRKEVLAFAIKHGIDETEGRQGFVLARNCSAVA